MLLKTRGAGWYFGDAMQKPQAEVNAIELLRLTLEELFDNTAAVCAANITEYLGSPPPRDELGRRYHPHAGEPIIVAAIRDWRERCRECVTTGFARILEAVPSSGLSSHEARRRAAELTWEAVDEVFGWTSGRGRAGRFKEWLQRVEGLNDHIQPMILDLPLVNVECKTAGTRTYVQLNCDFRRMLERRLAALSLGADLFSPEVPNGLEPQPDGGSAIDRDPAQPPYYNDALRATRSTINIPARGQLVEQVKKDLQQNAAHLDELRLYPTDAAAKYPCTAFDIYQRATKRQQKAFANCILHGRRAELAYRLAADVVAVADTQSMKRAWIEYRKKLAEDRSAG